jgi:hypothetical protein
MTTVLKTPNAPERNKESSVPSIPGLSTIPSIPGWDRTDSSSNVKASTDFVKEAEKALNDTDTKEMLKWTMMIVGGFTILQSLSRAFFSVCMVLLPGLYTYLFYTCPKEESFDVRKELKRVLRGYHLSDDHPDKPKGYLESVMARAVASVTVESTVLTGYKLELTSYRGAFIVAKLKLPSKEMEVYWIGIARQWHHVYTRNLGDNSKKSN